MSLFFVVFTLVFLRAFFSLKFKHRKSFDFYLDTVYALITAMLCLRFGQGVDYFNYRAIFYSVSSFDRIVGYVHGEPLFLFLCYIFNNIGNYESFVFVMSFAQMFMIRHFISRHSKNAAVSVLIFISIIYIPYFFNATRQGLAMSIFLCFGTKYIERRKWDKYIITCLLASQLHTVSLIYFTVPLVLLFRTGSVIRGSILCILAGMIILPRFEGALPYVASGSEARYIAAAERLLSFIAINFVYHSIYSERRGQWWMKLYCYGTGLYFIFLPYSLVASRLAVCFKALEIIIVPELISHRSRYRQLLIIYFFALSVIMFAHSLYAEAQHGGYPSLNPFKVPYVSVFNAQDIYNYRVNAPQ